MLTISPGSELTEVTAIYVFSTAVPTCRKTQQIGGGGWGLTACCEAEHPDTALRAPPETLVSLGQKPLGSAA